MLLLLRALLTLVGPTSLCRLVLTCTLLPMAEVLRETSATLVFFNSSTKRASPGPPSPRPSWRARLWRAVGSPVAATFLQSGRWASASTSFHPRGPPTPQAHRDCLHVDVASGVATAASTLILRLPMAPAVGLPGDAHNHRLNLHDDGHVVVVVDFRAFQIPDPRRIG